MTASVSLRNTSGGPLHLGTADGKLVDEDEVIHVEGKLAKDQPDDAIVIGDGDDARAWPTALWTKVGTAKNAEPDVTAPSNSQEG